MNDVLLPICNQHGANLVTGAGELSVTAVQSLVERITSKPTRIFYISDYDPAGQSMPVAVARKLEFLLRDSDADVRLYPIALTASKSAPSICRASRSRIRKAEKRALSSAMARARPSSTRWKRFTPCELAKIVKAAIKAYRDPTLQRRISEAHTRAYLEMKKIEEAILARYQETIEDADREWRAVHDEIMEQIAAYENKYNPLWKAIWKEMVGRGPRSWNCPQPVEADEIPNPLFDSGREYEEQLEAYKTFQRKNHD